MRRFVKALIPMAVTAAVSYFLLGLIMSDILVTVACAIVGQERYIIPYLILMMAFYSIISVVSHRIHKVRQSEERRAYLTVLGAEVYDRKADKKLIAHDKTYRAELVAYAVVATLQICLTFHPVYMIVCFPVLYGVFHFFNRRLWLTLRETWAEERIRLNPNQ